MFKIINLLKKIPEKEPDANQILVAMKREIPEPRPYPFCRSSSKHITMIPAKQSWTIIRMAFPTPSWLTLPYIPERTYATASPTAIRMPSSFCAPFLRGRENQIVVYI